MSTEAYEPAPSDIAIVGMSLRVPGATNLQQFWQNLKDGVESIRTIPIEELREGGEDGLSDRPNYVPRTADIPGMEMFDAEFFGMSPKDAAIMDPQHRHFLECAWAAMEDAGLVPEKQAGPVGVFAGCGMGSYFYFNICSNRELVDDVGMFLLRHTGNDKDFLSTRVSYAFDLRGPSVNVQTACSTSLVALHQACQSLLNGECDAALAGGVTIEQPHRRGYLFQEGEILSPDGHCRPFDHRAAGTVFGSGAAVVVLKRLADAIADGDHVHAVIKASAINNDGGRKSGYLAPSVTGQASAVIEAMGMAGIGADSIQYIECHGTGTYLGDPIEIQALTEAFKQSTDKDCSCFVGSVKSNLGHLDTAAGVVSLIKTVLSLQHGEIPPTLGFEKPNPVIAFEKGPFKVADRLTPWPAVPGRRRAAVNSLGVGGTNAHVILEAYNPPVPAAAALEDEAASVLVFSARNKDALSRSVRAFGQALETREDFSLPDASYTLATRRRAFDWRAVFAARGRVPAMATLSATDTRQLHVHQVVKSAGPVVFLLPGGGSQYAGMAGKLYRSDPMFRGIVDEGLAYLSPDASSEIRRAWLSDDVPAAERNHEFQRPSVQLPAIAIVEVALARLWAVKGVKPSALMGHSMGENAAACIADVMSFKDMVRLVQLRGCLFETVPRGGMLAVSLPSSEVLKIKPAALSLASVNAPDLCVVSGADSDLAAFQHLLTEREIENSRVPIDIAAHSHMLDGILAEFETFLRSISLRAPRIPIVSNVTGTWLTDDQARDPVYWVQHLRSTVQFATGMAVLSEIPHHIYLEVGPGRVLSSLAKLQPGIPANQVINTLPHPNEDVDDDVHFLAALGRCWAVGLDVDLATGWNSPPRHVSLPTYSFSHSRFFIDRVKPQEPKRELRVSRQDDMSDWGYEPVWKPTYAERLTGTAVPQMCWIALLDGAAITLDAVERLRRLGHIVIVVKHADAFARHSALQYSICIEEGEEAYSRLLDAIHLDGHVPNRVLHALLVADVVNVRMGSDLFSTYQDSGFFSLLYLIRALDRHGFAETVHIDVLTTGMQSIGSEQLPHPEKALICGPAQVIPKEFPGATVRLIDIDNGSSAKEGRRWLPRLMSPATVVNDMSELLLDDLLSAPCSETVAYRQGKRWRRDYRKLALETVKAVEGGETAAVTFRENGVYMLTGGLGDIALALTKDLVEKYSAKVVLTGRGQLPERAQWPLYRRLLPDNDRMMRAINVIEELEAKGAAILYIKADVTNLEDMIAARRDAEAACGPINGVIHTAGIVADNLIQMKTLHEIDTVLAPKVHGTLVLDRVFAQSNIDFLVLFSSTSSDLAPAGQVDYVAANAFMNAYADSRKLDPVRRTVAVHWGIWSEVGIAARAYGSPQPSNTAEVVLETASGPIFDHWVKDRHGATWLEAELGAKSHWFLDEHRLLNGMAVVPGTAYLEFIAQAMKEYGMALPATFSQVRFLSPIFVAEGETRRVRIRLRPSGDRYQVLIAADTGDDFAVMVDAQVETAQSPAPASIVKLPSSWHGSGSESFDGPALKSIQDDRIRFGPRWSVLRQYQIDNATAFAGLRLSAGYAGDFADGYMLHPGLMDIATGAGLGLLPEATIQQALWIPVVYGKITVYRPLAGNVVSISTLSAVQDHIDGFTSFDITLVDEHSNVLVTIDNYVMKRLESDLSFLKPEVPAEKTGKTSAAKSNASPGASQLNAYLRHGIRPTDGLPALERALLTGRSQPIVSSIDFTSLIASSQPEPAPKKTGMNDNNPEAGDAADGAPRNAVEQTLTAFWRELLGVANIGVDDNFFDVGGHSLIAVRLFRMIKKTFAIDIPMSVLFEAPTIAQCARVIGESLPDQTQGADQTQRLAQTETPKESFSRSYNHVVRMSPKEARSARPLFICAGMFGNVLNLRQLALHLSEDRPVYGLQARGLFGGLQPHETFDEMANDYLQELRSVQPFGPYHLAGFSGGGLVAYEMALRLVAEGETVSQLIMLDTPLPGNAELSFANRVEMKLQDIRHHRGAFFSNWLAGHVRSLNERRERRRGALAETGEDHFHNRDIEAAFYRALTRYQMKPYAGALSLLRPKLEVMYTLRDGRKIKGGRKLAIEDNGWSEFARAVTVHEVAGDHDSMILDPHVRALAAIVRKQLLLAEMNDRSELLHDAAE